MTFTVAELQLLEEALKMASSRHGTYSRDPASRANKKHADKAEAMQTLRDKLSSFAARHDVMEVARA